MRAQVVAERRAAREAREATARVEAMGAAAAAALDDRAHSDGRRGEEGGEGGAVDAEVEGARRGGGGGGPPPPFYAPRGSWRSTAQLQRLWGQQLALHAAEDAEAQRRGRRPASPGSLAAVVESERYEEQLRRLTELQRRVCEAHADPSLGAGLAGLPTALQDVGARLQRATDTSAAAR